MCAFVGEFAKFCVGRLLASLSRLYPHGTKLASRWTDFHEIRYLNVFRKSVKKIQV